MHEVNLQNAPALEASALDALPDVHTAKIAIRHLDFYYNNNHALKDINLTIPDRRITAIMGPSGCGKSTLLRVLNRIYSLYQGYRATGEVLLDGRNILEPSVDLPSLRFRVGMLYQKPAPFPMSIFDNVAFGLRLVRKMSSSELAQYVEAALRDAALWDEVKDILHGDAAGLSGGQQQRLCIARTIAVKPEVILFDEPTGALDPISTLSIENTLQTLSKTYAIVIVTHNLQQAARISDFTAFMYLGELIEAGSTHQVFTIPRDHRTEDFITGRFG